MSVAELTAAVGVHHNAVRQHLAQLDAAGLVQVTTARPTGRGRPRLEVTVDPAALGRWGGPGPYEDLSVLLAELLRSGDSAEVVGHRSARRRLHGIGAPRSSEPGADSVSVSVSAAIEVLLEDLARRGFDPDYVAAPTGVDAEAGSDTGGGVRVEGADGAQRRTDLGSIVLRRCPFESAALVDPDTVCGLHLGLARGVVDGSGLDVTALVPRDPRRAGCRLEIAAAPPD